MYGIRDLSEEEIASLEAMFEEWRNTPVRSKKKMIWGIIIAFVGFGACISETSSGIQAGTIKDIQDVIVLVVLGLIGALGALLFINGFRKKIRRK
jgi:hypothetical protein